MPLVSDLADQCHPLFDLGKHLVWRLAAGRSRHRRRGARICLRHGGIIASKEDVFSPV